MKKIFMAAMAVALGVPAAAQDTYESARLLGSDLNGTARYVGMGGAMEALGADISTMSSNPAGIGVFRHSTVGLSFGFQSQADAKEFDGLGKTNMSFDQVGFVYSGRISPQSFINVGFNYHKSKNFDQILSAANSLAGCSQNALTWEKAKQGIYDFEFNGQGDMIGMEYGYRSYSFNEADYLNTNILMLDPKTEAVNCYDASAYTFDRAHRGWIADYDFNLSGNYNDRFFWGVTLGVKDVRYKGYSAYGETLIEHDVNGNTNYCGSVAVADERKIKGTGFDVKFGVIVRPLEESAFRVGAYVHTPTWYELTASNSTYMLNNTPYGSYDDGESTQDYDFGYHTPWKFGLSLGTTVGTQLALGATYEYSDWGASQNRIIDGYDYYDNARTSKDVNMKYNTEQSLKGVSTFKVGAEYKPVPEVSLRLGYNYLTSGYKTDGVRDQSVDSPGVMYASTTDYVNWKDTQRLTAGVGFKVGQMNIDLAYQFSKTDGDFHPFQDYSAAYSSAAFSTGVTKVSNKRNQALLTIGYTF